MKTKTILTALAAISLSTSIADTADRIRAKTSRELAAYTIDSKSASGTASFDFKGNDGKFTIRNGETSFVTEWSSCSTNSVTAYRDGVELAGWKDGVADFPATASSFETWDWKRRSIKVAVGGIVAFMEKGGKICAVRVLSVRDRDRGAVTDNLKIEYRIY